MRQLIMKHILCSIFYKIALKKIHMTLIVVQEFPILLRENYMIIHLSVKWT